jgi:hypothetical protein
MLACHLTPFRSQANRNTAIALPDLNMPWRIMMLKASAPKIALIPEATYPATLSSIKGLPDETNPKKVAIGFKIDGHDTEVVKEVSVSFDTGKPLRKDAETILGRELTNSEAQSGFDINKLIGKLCQVVVMHKAASGGKPQAVVSVVLKAE